jgi:DNA-binding NarL/FixJ family response regulator
MPVILIAEDHAVVRMGISMMIKSIFPDAVTHEAINFDQAVQMVSAKDFDLVLLDIHMPGGDNLQMVEALRLRKAHVPILIFSSYEEQLYALRYLEAGANGFLPKKSDQDTITLAIRTVLGGDIYISNNLRNQLLQERFKKRPEKQAAGHLSPREVEVMQWLVKGKSPSEIRQIMNVHSSTISTYKTRIFEKMEVSNLIELADKVRLLDQTATDA